MRHKSARNGYSAGLTLIANTVFIYQRASGDILCHIVACFSLRLLNKFFLLKSALTFYETIIINYQNFGNDAVLSVPNPDHYLPFIYILGLRKEMEKVSFPVQGVDGGSVSMLAVQIG